MTNAAMMPSKTATGPALLRGADILADSLVRAGVRTLFGVPGDTGVTFYDALRARAHDLRHVLMRDERHAAAAADSYARVSNTVGVVEVSSGGGVTYVVGGLGEAYAASVPLLVITSDIHTRSRGTGALTEIDQETLLRAVTKWRRTIDDPRGIREAVAEALHEATSGRPAPVALIFPEDVLDATAPAASSRRGAVTLPGERTQAPATLVGSAAGLLAGAARPAVLAGSGVHVSGAYRNLRLLAERAGLAVATTIHGKGAIPESSGLALGVAGNNGGRPYANSYLSSADVVLLVGTRANATDTNIWRGPARDGRAAVIQIDIEPSRAGQNYPGSLALVGDADTVLAQLLAAVPADAARAERVTAAIGQARRWEAAQAAGPGTEPGTLAASAVIATLHETLGPDTIVVADPGTPTPNVAAYWQTTAVGRTVIMPRGHGPMGYAIPGAIGASLAMPGRPVLAVTADGSFAMSCGELETVARLRLPVIFVQLTNFSLGWIKMLQHLYFGQRYFDVDPGPIDAPQVARAAGLDGLHVTALDELKAVVTDAAAALRPTYVDITVPSLMDDVPPVSSWHDARSGSHARPTY